MVATIAFTVCVARYYSITRAGRRQLAREQENWQQIAGVVNRVLKLAPEE
jgi:DNA-binding PadR family transcriptional regulator